MQESLKALLTRPLAVGNRMVDKRLVLSPMAGVGHLVFRELVAGFGGYGLLFSEMCNARSVAQGNKNILLGYMWNPRELPRLVCQIYGNQPQVMADAARRIQAEGFFGVDLNFGCSVAKMCRQNYGAALLKQPDLAGRIVAAVRKAVSVPLFVKFRTGWSDDPLQAVELARRFEDAGADAVTYHPRVAPDRRTRPPRWAYIQKVKTAVRIPVFGNGNVFSAEDCLRLLHTTGCDGVSIGRLALAKPWIFAEWTRGVTPEPAVYRDTALKLLERMADRFGPDIGLRRYLKFMAYFSANFKFGHSLYAMTRKAATIEAQQKVLHHFFNPPPDLSARLRISLTR